MSSNFGSNQYHIMRTRAVYIQWRVAGVLSIQFLILMICWTISESCRVCSRDFFKKKTFMGHFIEILFLYDFRNTFEFLGALLLGLLVKKLGFSYSTLLWTSTAMPVSGVKEPEDKEKKLVGFTQSSWNQSFIYREGDSLPSEYWLLQNCVSRAWHHQHRIA